MTPTGNRPRIAAVIAGLEFQHLIAWCEVLRAIQPASGVAAMTVEALEAGNVDDIVIEYDSAPFRFLQAKHAVDATTPVGTQWLISGSGARTLLQRFHDSWQRLRAAGHEPAMELVTDREIDPHDPLLRVLDRDTELLVPQISNPGPRSDIGRARKAWAEHLEVPEDNLIEMLGSLRFRTGRSALDERNRAADLMWGHGFVHDPAAVDAGVGAIRSWVRERDRRLTLDKVRQLVADTTTPAQDPAAVLVVEAIDSDPHPEDATFRLRWVELFAGSDAMTRRDLRDPADWSRIESQLAEAADALRGMGMQRVLVRGAMRQAILFAVGATLREVAGFKLGYQQRGALWDTEDVGVALPLTTQSIETTQGSDVAVVVAIAADALSEVQSYVATAAIPVDWIVAVSPVSGPRDRSIEDGATAVATATAIRNEVRTILGNLDAERIHLFLAGPGGMALLLGHRWNALRPTVVYEYLGAGAGYAPTLTVQA
jgi:SMODS-associated and fused to various effectors sensor domain